MKELKKLSLSNMQGKLSRKEMKTIMAGSGSDSKCDGRCTDSSSCPSNCSLCYKGFCQSYS